MSELNVAETSNDCSNDSLLLDRVFLRLGNADTDEQLENCLNRFLPPVILKLSSPHEQIRTKVMELLIHVNKRVRCRNEVQLPVETLLQSYKDPSANSFIINFSIIYITMGFPRLPKDQQISLVPTLLEAIENKPVAHQDGILMLVMPLLGDIKESNLNLKGKPKVANLILKFATDVLLLPYRALPNSGESEFQVPPGMSLRSYKRIVDKNQINPNQLEEMKLSIVSFLSEVVGGEGEVVVAAQVVVALVVAAADSRFSVANLAHGPLARAAGSLDWSSAASVLPLYSLYLGTWGGAKVAPDDRKVAACTRLRLKLVQYLNRATGPAVVFPHCVQVVFSSLFVTNTNSRLRNMAIMFLLNVINKYIIDLRGNEVQLRQVASVFLQGLLKLIRTEEHAEHHAKAYMCLGRLAMKCPSCFTNQFALLEELVKKIPEVAPEIKTALRDALLEMAVAYKITPEGPAAEEAEGGASKTRRLEPHALALFAILDHYMQCDEPLIRYVAMRYAAAVFPSVDVPSRYLLLLAAGDSQEDISTEALKYLYGTSRSNEIEDVVNNVSRRETDIGNVDENVAKRDKDKTQEDEFESPRFNDVVDYVWDQMQKRKKSSNVKHRFVMGNQVLQFHPLSYREILRYLRMCLNRDANLKDCSDHPNDTSPVLAKYLLDNLVDTDVLDRYLTMVTSLLSASPDKMPLTCFLDVVGCIPEKLAGKYISLLPFLKRLLTSCTKEDIREISATIYAIVRVNAGDKSSIEREITDVIAEARGGCSLEARCGLLWAGAHLTERCIALWKRNLFGGKGFNPEDWEPYRETVSCLALPLRAGPAPLALACCSAVALLVRCSALPLQPLSAQQEARLRADDPFLGDDPDEDLTKFSVARSLFRLAADPKLPSKLKERSLNTLGLMCCGERLSFAKEIVKGLVRMAENSKEFEIHLQIGESLVLCVEGVNSNESRDLWTELPKKGEDKVRDLVALKEDDATLQWLLAELFQLAQRPHPHSRQATCIWLLALLKNCPERAPIRNSLQLLQDNFMEFLSENSDIVQDVASKGLSLVYLNSAADRREALVSQLVEQLTSGKRAHARVDENTRVFEQGQLGKTPDGGNLSTYRELCSLASDLNQPDMLYQFMHLAHHNSIWNSKRGAAFGFQSLSAAAGGALAPQLSRLAPRLFRYRFDPAPRIQAAMSAIWSALVTDTPATVRKYHGEILNDLVANLTSNQWRVRMSCCNALAELLRVTQNLHQSLEQLPTIWTQLFRVMDDVHEGTRLAATAAAHVLSKVCVQACDVNRGKDGVEVSSAILPVLLDTGITNLVKEVRGVSLQTVSQLVSSAGASLAGLLARLVPALAAAAGELEPARLQRLAAALHDEPRDALDGLRAAAARAHHTTDALVKCMPYITIDIMREMLPKILELTKSPQLGTKVACAHFLVLSAHYLRGDLEPIAGKIMTTLLNGIFDRNATVRKNYAEALGQVSAHAKPQAIEKLMKKLIHLYESKEDDASRSAIALTLNSIAKAKIEHIKDNEEILAPVVFLAMHASKDDDSSTAEAFEELWSDMSPSRALGARRHLRAVSLAVQSALSSAGWASRIQAANAVKTICKDLANELGEEREPLARALLAATQGRTFDGKHRILEALADACVAPPGEALPPALSAAAGEALLRACGRGPRAARRRALAALAALARAPPACAPPIDSLYEVVGRILDERSAPDEDDEDEDAAGVTRRREETIALRDAAHDLLGGVWPEDAETQEKYRDLYLERCSESYPGAPGSTQLAILSSLAGVLRRLAVLAPPPPGEAAAPPAAVRDAAVARVARHVAAVVEYTLGNSSRVRNRRDALNLMEILVKRLKELNKIEELNKLRAIYEKYARDLSKEESHELRSKVEDIKGYFE